MISTRALDALLTPIVECLDEVSRDAAVTALLRDYARPLVRAILRSRLSGRGDRTNHQELDDLESEAMLQLIARLGRLAADPIGDFRAYLAVVVYNAWNAYLRLSYPRRWHLDSRVQYLLSHDPRFAMWITDRGESHCSLGEFRQGLPASVADIGDAISATAHGTLSEVVVQILHHVGSPVPVGGLVRAVGAVLGVKDEPDVEVTDQIPANDESSRVEERLDRATLLRAVWDEIHDLPLPQKQALLLGLRGEGGEALMPFLPPMGLATRHELASELEIQPAELATLWELLPLDDLTIAGRLGLTRQQVINLRKSARERLGRRLRDLRQKTT